MTKSQLLKKAKLNREKATKLLNEAINLEAKANCIPGRGERLTEEAEAGRGKLKGKTFIITRLHWEEKFKDEDNPKNSIVIERSKIVKVNGEFVDDFGNSLVYFN